jgi:hypothetical protein
MYEFRGPSTNSAPEWQNDHLITLWVVAAFG